MYVTDLRLSNWIIAHDKALFFFCPYYLNQLCTFRVSKFVRYL